MTPTTTPPVAARFIDHVLHATDRTREWLDRLVLPQPAPAGPWLDLGCGTADLAEAAPSGQVVIGIDVAFRWLIAARRRLYEAGRPAWLVCCNAEHLPFPPRAFARVLSRGIVEHCDDPQPVFAEAARVLIAGGQLASRTVNRFSLLPEPHVGLWGVGFMPRRWASRYIGWRQGHPYRHRPVSAAELDRAARRAGLTDVSSTAAALLTHDRARLGRLAVMAGVYDAAAHLPIARQGLRLVAPLIDTIARAA